MSTLSLSTPARVFLRQSRALTSANLKSRYRRTIAGFLWVVLNPIVQFGVQGLIFKHVLKIQVGHYLIFLLSGLLPWIFIVQSMDMCTSLFVTNGNVLKSFRINPMVLLTAQLMDNLLNFLAAFLILFVILAFQAGGGIEFQGLAFTPLAVLVLLSGVTGISWLLATTQVFLRDTRFVIQFGTSVLFFLTPVFYPPSLVPPELQIFSAFNPLYRLIEPFRISVYEYHPDTFQLSLMKGALTAALLLGAAATLWYRKRRAIYVHL